MEKIKVFLLGVLTAVGLMILIGAGPQGQVGRYQLVDNVGWPMNAWVIDTTTGQVAFISMENKGIGRSEFK